MAKELFEVYHYVDIHKGWGHAWTIKYVWEDSIEVAEKKHRSYEAGVQKVESVYETTNDIKCKIIELEMRLKEILNERTP